MDFKEYMKRSFVEHLEHVQEYNVTDHEFYEAMSSFIYKMAGEEAMLNAQEIFGYADHLMNKLVQDSDLHREAIEMKVGETITIKVE
ncbi:hypothetical protein D1804_14990 [Salmonella enterica subsp. enterica serovar Lagos]|nr:hypothetical protein [Salmonella enterica subsp. enterica serovar Lagos]